MEYGVTKEARKTPSHEAVHRCIEDGLGRVHGALPDIGLEQVSKGVSETVEVENRHTARGQHPPDLRDRQPLIRVRNHHLAEDAGAAIAAKRQALLTERRMRCLAGDPNCSGRATPRTLESAPGSLAKGWLGRRALLDVFADLMQDLPVICLDTLTAPYFRSLP